MDRDPAAERHVADNRVTRDGAAALGEPHHDVVDALDDDAVVGGLLRTPLALVATLQNARQA